MKEGMIYKLNEMNKAIQLSKLNTLNNCNPVFEEWELDLYDDYCQFIKRKFLDEVIEKPDELIERVSIDDISSQYVLNGNKKIKDGNIKSIITYNNETYIFSCIGFIIWLKMMRRDKKIDDLLK